MINREVEAQLYSDAYKAYAHTFEATETPWKQFIKKLYQVLDEVTERDRA